MPVVAIGASAGGIEALKTFVEHLPPEPGCAFIILQHLAPDHESQLSAILARAARLPVVDADHDLPIKPDTIFVLPPDRYLRIAGEGLFVEPPEAPRGQRMAIDYFMRSLARSSGPRAVGVVLSGTGSDGSAGLREIRAAGGLALAQSPETALYEGMPSAAIDQGVVDFIGPIDELVKQILSIVENAAPADDDDQASGEEEGITDDQLKSVIAVLKARIGHDFGAYKSGTTRRRVARRMNLLRFSSAEEYLTHLRATSSECDKLFHDLLINVTSFFRDPAIWKPLADTVETLLAGDAADPLRVWVPACASGEEAYSLAILFEEICERIESECRWQIFATDLDAEAIARARQGQYPLTIENDVSPERLKRWFEKAGDGYRIEKALCERVVFAQHNLLTDPPFSRLDMISCRNFLIYLTVATQNRLLDMFHFALRDNGYILLSTSETAGQRQRYFKTVSAQAHIYQRLPGNTGRAITPPVKDDQGGRGIATRMTARASRRADRETLAENVRRSLLSRFGPASAVIDPDGEVAFYHGSIRRFLQIPEGEPSHNLYDLLSPSLRVRVREAVRETGEVSETRLNVRRARLSEGDVRVRIECERLPDEDRELYLVSFIEERDAADALPMRDANEKEADYVRQLEHELLIVREDLQTTIEELETSNEELKASNEEAMAANEELQSTNEELETSREELQSLNEELVTVNSQLEEKLTELERATGDLGNLFASTRVPVLFLGNDLTIRSFTPNINEVAEIRASDEGRPVTDFAFKVNDANLVAEAKRVLAELGKAEDQVATGDGRIYLRRIQPYRTTDERIGGVVISYAEVTQLVRTTEKLAQRERQQRAIAELGQSALSVRDGQRLLEDACSVLRLALECDYVKVLELSEDRSEFTLRAGTGWKPGLVGSATVPNSTQSQAGYTMAAGDMVVVDDFEKESRFAAPELLTAHNVRSGMSTVLSLGGVPWGVLGAHSRTVNRFGKDDLAALRNVATIISQTLTELAREEYLVSERLTLDLAVNAAELSVWNWEPESDRSSWDEKLFRMLGYSGDTAVASGEAFFAAVDPADRDRVRKEIARTYEKGIPFASEFRIQLPDGSTRWLAGRGARIPGSSPPRLTGVNFDITDRKQSEDRQQLIMRELDHRVKNMLAIILSITRLTARSDVALPVFLESFTNRLQAMARTHALLAEGRWRGLTLRAVIEEELAQYRAAGAQNLMLDGPDLLISPEAGQSLSMAIHELATNAAKYGALSTPAGRLTVRWSRRREGKEGMLAIEWIERDGPKVSEPDHTGFGTTVLNRILTSQLRAKVQQRFPEAGMELRIEVPQGEIAQAPEAPPEAPAEPARHVDLSIIEGKRVLVLDDEWLIGEEHRAALEKVGAKIIGPFTRMASARETVEGDDPDLAILDFNIAGDPVTPLAADLLDRRIPVIIVTGYGSSLTVPGELSGAVMMHKPVSIGALIRQAAIRLTEKAVAADEQT
ncbi:PAS domain-containing protein [Stakelama sp. CBK3Z-3]|uniref:histidine kinase n=2 Tax=Stakelama flava TaxID=2860338 RepID=A0ABS6XKS6_9SPHN|nr:PAS domain-containing protein [Stakelama flava]